MAREGDFDWQDDLMTKSYQRQESHLARLARTHGKDYGKPRPGSDSERRSLAYQKEVVKECVNICQMVAQFGTRLADGTEQIQFGDLFRLTEGQTNKCVGILQRARKHRLLHFPGETLWQGEDDKVMVTLIRRNREVQVYFEQTRQLLPNSPGGNSTIEVGSECRRAHFPWVLRVTEERDLTTYHLRLEEAEEDDDHELPQRCFPLNKGEEWRTPEYKQEPKGDFKLDTLQAIIRPLALCCPEEYFTPCLPGEQGEVAPLPYTLPTVSLVHEPRAATPPAAAKPLVRSLPRPEPPPPRAPSPPPPSPPPRPVRPKLTMLEMPQFVPPVRRTGPAENPKCSIKFSRCTTLYVAPKPTYGPAPHRASLPFTIPIGGLPYSGHSSPSSPGIPPTPPLPSALRKYSGQYSGVRSSPGPPAQSFSFQAFQPGRAKSEAAGGRRGRSLGQLY